jgi:hypothetical protein
MPLADALRVAGAIVGSGLGAHDLIQKLHAGRFTAAVRVIGPPDGTDECFALKAAFWPGVTYKVSPVDAGLLLVSVNAPASEEPPIFFQGYFFIKRCEFVREYPDAAAADKPPRADDDVPPPPTRRRPGKRPKFDWPVYLAREVIRHIRTGKPVPKAKKLADICTEKWGWEPPMGEINRLLTLLLG